MNNNHIFNNIDTIPLAFSTSVRILKHREPIQLAKFRSTLKRDISKKMCVPNRSQIHDLVHTGLTQTNWNITLNFKYLICYKNYETG